MQNTINDQWINTFRNVGLPEEYISEYIIIIEALQARNLPVIFEVNHLSKLVGIDLNVLYKMIFSNTKFYRHFKIPKRKGGERDIFSPYPSLYSVQSWIYKNILKENEVHPNAHGFVEKKSIITNAKVHLGNQTILQMDLKNFFPSIKINWIVKYFYELGYSEKVSFYLASLCCYEDELAQGSPASPYLSNLLLRSLDVRLVKISNGFEINYSRYADDLTFSGENIPYNFIRLVKKIIIEYGLSVNDTKTRLKKNARQKIITGISISNNKISLPREYKRNLIKELYFIEKYGYMSHISKKKINDPYYLLRLIGKVGFWKQVEPSNEKAEYYYKMLNGIFKN